MHLQCTEDCELIWKLLGECLSSAHTTTDGTDQVEETLTPLPNDSRSSSYSESFQPPLRFGSKRAGEVAKTGQIKGSEFEFLWKCEELIQTSDCSIEDLLHFYTWKTLFCLSQSKILACFPSVHPAYQLSTIPLGERWLLVALRVI